MPQEIATTKTSHQRLVSDLLPKAFKVIERTLDMDPYEPVLDSEGNDTGAKKFNGRLNSQALKAAMHTTNLIEKLGDQELKRQAGNQMKKLIAAIKKRDPDALKTINHQPALPAQTAATKEQDQSAP